MRTPFRILTLLFAATLVLPAACTSPVPGQASVAPSGGPSSTAPLATADPFAPPAPPVGDGPLEGAIPRPTPGGTATGAVRTGLEDFYAQQLDWQDCQAFNANPDLDEYYATPGLECANLVVPLDYTDPAGPTVSLGVIRAAATGADRVGAVQIDPGGPGVSAVDTVAVLAAQGSAAALHETMDLVGMDTRGVGSSRPQVECLTDAQTDAARAANDRTTTPAGIAAIDAALTAYVAACVGNTGRDAGVDGAKFLAAIGTASTVQDMDVLRSALGEEQLTFLGLSYGTLLGSVYADEFPANVRAMTLDGAVDPAADADQEVIDQNAGFQGTFESFAAWCAQQDSCVLAGDPDQATADFQALARPLLDTPLELRDGRVLTFGDALTGTGQALYDSAYWPTLRTALQNLADGDGYLLMVLADQYDQRDSEGHYSSTQDVFTAVRCVDSARTAPGAASESLEERARAAAPFRDSGDPVAASDDVCSRWPGQVTLDADVAAAPDLATTVVVSTTGDPATPYAAGQELAGLLDARLITVEGDRHTAYFGGSDCVVDAVDAYLTELTLPEDGLVCS